MFKRLHTGNLIKCMFYFVLVCRFQFRECSLSQNKTKQVTTQMNAIRDFSWVEKVKVKDAGDRLLNPLAKDLRIIGLFLAAHKYFDVDRRYTFTSAQYEKPKFYKHFPIPRLRKRYPSVVSACDNGFILCVNEIFKKANFSGSLAKIHKNFGNRSIQYASYHPFKDSQELFSYRVTASYYMCWYTDMREESLALPDTYDCFKDLEKTEEANGKQVIDFRSRIAVGDQSYSMFTCSYLWFCPDPCYGKSTNGTVKSKSDAFEDPKNPCRNLRKKDCFWSVGKNKNLEDLVRNKFNYSCECENEHKGFVWSPMYSLCVDRDECYEGKYSCPESKICRNTVGSYKCTCRRGYYVDKETNVCIRHDLLSAEAATALKRQKKEKEVTKKSPGGATYILKLLVEIVKGHCIKPSGCKLLSVFCVLIVTYSFIDFA